MFGSSFGDLALRKPPDPSFADELNVPKEHAVLVFDVRRAAVSLSLQVQSACFELFADEVPKEAQPGSLAHLPKIFFSHLHGLSKVAIVGFCA